MKLTLASYGRSVIPPDMQLQDWGVSYDELEPYYDRFEKLCGISGKAGNLQGKKIDGGNVFEAPGAATIRCRRCFRSRRTDRRRPTSPPGAWWRTGREGRAARAALQWLSLR